MLHTFVKWRKRISLTAQLQPPDFLPQTFRIESLLYEQVNFSFNAHIVKLRRLGGRSVRKVEKYYKSFFAWKTLRFITKSWVLLVPAEVQRALHFGNRAIRVAQMRFSLWKT